ncbi:MAG: ATP phosphoribosyltransferase [Clostridiales bacterium]|jgi:ATP phosphoribosyltransferase|nr:ATP phosphoribosyltransferase [Clostridiales bacterium]HOB64655.1 ATP phosphoribosyltransferase [Clostridia bacterium]HOK82360.1 ATP phosphoribosyltransferase [Clostridia bacterium]
MFNIALPKGRLAEKVCGLLAGIGFDTSEVMSDSRRLVFTDAEGKVSYFLVKPSDVAIYVERGVADIGVVGKDILLETKPDVYELLDLGIGKCTMSVAAKEGFRENKERPLRVATKFVNIASEYYSSLNREIEIIKLNGSIELAPILDMSDVIVDIVETGTTLKNNNMKVISQIMPISARLIANKTSYKFKSGFIDELTEKLAEAIK